MVRRYYGSTDYASAEACLNGTTLLPGDLCRCGAVFAGGHCVVLRRFLSQPAPLRVACQVGVPVPGACHHCLSGLAGPCVSGFCAKGASYPGRGSAEKPCAAGAARVSSAWVFSLPTGEPASGGSCRCGTLRLQWPWARGKKSAPGRRESGSALTTVRVAACLCPTCRDGRR